MDDYALEEKTPWRTGNAGSMVMDGCGQPVFYVTRALDDPSSLIVEYQVWDAAL